MITGVNFSVKSQLGSHMLESAKLNDDIQATPLKY